VTGALDPVQLLRRACPLVGVDRHPRRDGLAADDEKQRPGGDQVRVLERVEKATRSMLDQGMSFVDRGC
jgi:hypothetical protein